MERKDHSSTYHLRELGESKFEVAKGEPDLRGWKVIDAQGNILGKVKELLCDPKALKVRYLIVDLEGNVLDLEPRDIMVPIGLAELHASDDLITVPNVSPAQLQALPRYQAGQLNQDMERLVQRIFVGDHVHGTSPAPLRTADNPDYSHEQYNQNNLYRNRKAKNVIGLFNDAGTAQRVTQELVNSGFSKDNIEVALRNTADNQEGYSTAQFEEFFYSLFATQQEAHTHQAKMQKSMAVVVVRAYSQDEANRAAHLLDSNRTPELDIAVEKTDASSSFSGSNARTSMPAIPVIEERRAGDQRGAETERTDFASSGVERSLEEHARPGQEQIQLERVPITRPTNEADFASFQEGIIELKEYAEVPIISKEAYVVEEITLGKEVEIREEVVRDTVRKTEIQIDDLKEEEMRRRHNDRNASPGTSTSL
ncbi:DUF2382 domain-containing protein [Rufibacter sediminis]|uniref:PRC and DUF2382 domain-containing protein n=1 Tax=Rufibacter sediminis TaxID=2762756 RepID=A0ABR6VWB9_9BACT|nr:PRC and DUF2382 domain-containing protein [Rufibacter sediminis]MBC3541133.1 PRC and DUF2382 domain-containing protein [Rufibacter sediminis]